MTPWLVIAMPLADRPHPLTFEAVSGIDLPECRRSMLTRKAAPVEQARNEIVQRLLMDPALAEVTHILWVDDDMVFNPDAVKRLMVHDLPIVGGLCHGRRAPNYAPILLYRNGATYSYRYEFPRGLIEVDATGAAFLLVKREVFETLEKAYPEPGEGPFSQGGEHTRGEDVAFCERAKACGYKIMIDTTIEVGHVGEVVIDSVLARKLRAAEFNPWSPPAEIAEGEPQASIIIPTYNQRPEFLRAAVESAIAQTVPVEVLVIDDGSTEDLDPGIILGEHERVHIEYKPHQGCFPALNEGIRMMRTPYFAWLSSDDVFYPTKIERQIRHMRNVGTRASFHGYDQIDIDGAKEGARLPQMWRTDDECRRCLAWSCFINGLTVLIERSLIDEIGPFDESITIAADWDYWCKISLHEFWLPIPEILAARREHGGNDSIRFRQDPAKAAIWDAEDKWIREKYKPRCRRCGEVP